MASSRSALVLSGVLSATVPSLAGAQTVPPAVPAPPTREELQRDTVRPAPQERPRRVSVEGAIERSPCPLADPRFAEVTMLVSDVRFDGLQMVGPEALRPSWSEFAGKRVPVSTLCEIRDRAATILRHQGYLAAVQVPPQRIEDNGVVRFEVLMAKLVKVQVRGDVGRAEGVIARQLAKLQEAPVFNTFDAERYLLLVGDIPGYDARLTLRPAGTRPGEVIGEVTVVYKPFELDVNVQNLGSRDVGRFGGMIRAQIHGLTGLADTTTLAYFNTFDWSEQHVVQASHSFRVGSEGLTLGGDFTYAWTRPDIGGGNPFRARTLIGTLRAAYPLLRSQARNVVLTGGLDLVNQSVRFNGITVSRDKLRVLFARLDFDTLDRESIGSISGYSAAEPRWRVGGSVELRQGVSILGASKACGPAPLFTGCAGVFRSRLEGDPTAFLFRAAAYAEFRPTPKLAFSLSPRAQYASHPLFAFEEFSAGNYTIGRGYDPGALIGDRGIGVQAEVRVGSLVPRGAESFAFQPFAFFDAARVENRDAFSLYPRDPQSLYSAGGGLRAAWGNRARLDAYVAVPLRHIDYFADPANRVGLARIKGDVRFLMSLTVKLLPWTR